MPSIRQTLSDFGKITADAATAGFMSIPATTLSPFVALQENTGRVAVVGMTALGGLIGGWNGVMTAVTLPTAFMLGISEGIMSKDDLDSPFYNSRIKKVIYKALSLPIPYTASVILGKMTGLGAYCVLATTAGQAFNYGIDAYIRHVRERRAPFRAQAIEQAHQD